jgi:hypothetical protein
MAASDQIRQMVNFILQEAHEKANEIRVKVRRNKQTMHPEYTLGQSRPLCRIGENANEYKIKFGSRNNQQ